MVPESGTAATGSEPDAGYDTNRRASPLYPHRRSESGIIPQGMAQLTEKGRDEQSVLRSKNVYRSAARKLESKNGLPDIFQ